MGRELYIMLSLVGMYDQPQTDESDIFPHHVNVVKWFERISDQTTFDRL